MFEIVVVSASHLTSSSPFLNAAGHHFIWHVTSAFSVNSSKSSDIFNLFSPLLSVPVPVTWVMTLHSPVLNLLKSLLLIPSPLLSAQHFLSPLNIHRSDNPSTQGLSSLAHLCIKGTPTPPLWNPLGKSALEWKSEHQDEGVMAARVFLRRVPYTRILFLLSLLISTVFLHVPDPGHETLCYWAVPCAPALGAPASCPLDLEAFPFVCQVDTRSYFKGFLLTQACFPHEWARNTYPS